MTIGAYLAELERELHRRRAPRARLLREVEDHLRDLCAELATGGLTPEQAEARAVRQFGAAPAVAARFAAATASTTAHRAVASAVGAFVAYGGVFAAFATAASPLLRDFPQGAPSFFALQLGAATLLLATVRSLRWRGAVAAPAAELKSIARALSVGCAALLGAAVAEGAVALSRPAGFIAWSDGRWLTIAHAAAAGVSLVSAINAIRASAQAQAIDGLRRADTTAAALLADDVDALLGPARVLWVGRALRALLARPWPTALTLAASAFVAVSAAGVADSGSSGTAGAAMLGAVEATFIVVCFAALAGPLGLRASPQR